jgi:hypothetical protein
LVKSGGYKTWASILLFAVVLPGIASTIGLLGDTLAIDGPDNHIIKSGIVLLLIPVIASEGIDLIKHVVRWSLVIAAFPLALALVLVFVPSLLPAVYTFTFEKGAMIAIPDHDTLGLGFQSFYYLTVAVLVFPIAYYLRNLLDHPKKLLNWIVMVMLLGSVLASGNRATVLGAFVVVAAIVFQKLRARFNLVVASTFLLVVAALSTGYVAAFFHPGESSNAAKLGHIRSYVAEFEDHPTYLLWGQGSDTVFYTQGFQTKTSMTELSYLDMIRWFGVPVAAVILIALFYPVFELARRASTESYVSIPYFAYLCEVATNPLLICWAGLLLVSAIWGLVLIRRAGQTPALESIVES